MKHEKTVTLKTGRLLKIIVTEVHSLLCSEGTIQVEVLVMDPKDDDFRLPIGESHPQFWKLKRLNEQQARTLQIQYSGVMDKQIKRAIKEFRRMTDELVLS
ncbi:hypothetical protein DYBT9275_05832 [Dyadobacter sp. CECT 9275]|uniref:Uncharacterized protein n=1 Tax=Dyadobacter helix TaxID=2822344 RepID=A0A916JI86_9BACT|nr:hypothetical protein [Dyadobacter sp. CECT 9275]CAG5017721.1 hypothetical protein DYBT9275_05832 [Dyadobacter sp. CECT 9275]